MSVFIVIEKSTRTEVARYSAMQVFEGVYPLATHEHKLMVSQDPVPSPPPPALIWTPVEFLRRLTPAERIATRELANTDPVVRDFMHILDRAPEVRSDDPDTIAGLDYLALKQVLAAGRVWEVLHG